MGKGYHSRSPEEFREYLRNIGKSAKKSRYRQFVLIFDLVLIILIFYIGFRALNPGTFGDRTQSEKQIVDGHSSYLSLSREEDNLYQGYFLFIDNNTTKPISVPFTEWKAEFRIKTRSGILCYNEPIVWEKRQIPSEAKGFLYHSVSKKKLKELLPDCRKEIFDEDYSFFRSRFRALDLGFYSQVVLESSDKIYTFEIKQKPYR